MHADPSNLSRAEAAEFASVSASATRPAAYATTAAAGEIDALFLMNSLHVGGSERKVIRLANQLGERSMRIGIAWLNAPDTLASSMDAAVQRWPLNRKGKFSFAVVKRLVAIVKQHKPRVLFCVNMYPTLYARALQAALGSEAPRLVALINTTDFGPGERWRQRFYSYFLQGFDWLVYGCELQRQGWQSVSRRLGERSQVIYNGVDIAEFNAFDSRDELRTRAGFTPSSFVVGTVGRLVPAKNQRVLIDSVAALRHAGIDARLIVVGDGPLRSELETYATDQGLSSVVRFAGPVKDVRPLIATFDVFVLPSLYIETFSNAALEAMSMGTPVVLSRVGGAAEMIRDGEEGYLIDPQQLDERLPTVLQQIATDAARRRAMAARARERVERDFAFQGMVEQYASLIRRFAV